MQAAEGEGGVVDIVEHILCTGIDQLKGILAKIEEKGGEGSVFRFPFVLLFVDCVK